MMIRRLGVALVTSLLGTAATAAPVLPNWRLAEFASPTVTSSADAINNQGVATGYFLGNTLWGGASTWTAGQRQIVIPSPGARPAAINSAGQITGTAFTGNGFSAFVRNPDGSLVTIGGLLGEDSDGVDINDSGAVLVGTSNGNGTSGAFVWKAGVATPVVGLGGNPPLATAMNNAGAVVGQTGNSMGNTQAFLWAGGTMISLGSLGNSDSTASDINDTGIVVGDTTTPDGWRAFRWTNGQMTALADAGGQTTATAINSQGWIVGAASTSLWTGTAALWIDDQLFDLAALVPALAAFEVSYATGINDQGWIIGNGLRGGVQSGWLLVPRGTMVPEPQSWALLIAGFGLTGAAMRRRRAAVT